MTEHPATPIRRRRRISKAASSLAAACAGMLVLVWGCGGESEGGLGLLDVDGPRIEIVSVEESETAGLYRLAVRAWDPFGGVQVQAFGARPVRNDQPDRPLVDASPRFFLLDFSGHPGLRQFEVVGTDASGNVTRLTRELAVHPHMACAGIGSSGRGYPPADLVEDGDGGIWALDRDGLWRFDFATFGFRRAAEWNGGSYASLRTDRRGTLWAIKNSYRSSTSYSYPDTLVAFDASGISRTLGSAGRLFLALADGSADSIRGIWAADWSSSTPPSGYGYFTVADTGIAFGTLESSGMSAPPLELACDSSGLAWLRFRDSLVAYRLPAWERELTLRDGLPTSLAVDRQGRIVLVDSVTGIRRTRVGEAWIADSGPAGERRCLDAPRGRTWCLPGGELPGDPTAAPETSFVSLYRDGVLVRRHIAFSHPAVAIVDAAGRLWTTTGRLQYGSSGNQEVCAVSEERF